MVRSVVAGALVAAVAVLLVVPFHPEAPLLRLIDGITPATPAARSIDWFLVESGGNFVVFAVVGVAARVLVRRSSRALALACLLSVVAELAQLAIPGRVASWTDVVTNCLGAAGGVLATVLIDRARERRAGTAPAF